MPTLHIQHAVPNAERLLERLGKLWAGPGGAVMRDPAAWIVDTVEAVTV